MSIFDIQPIFNLFNNHVKRERDTEDFLRVCCKEPEQLSREMASVLAAIHAGEKEIGPACRKIRQMLFKARECYQILKDAVPVEYLFILNNIWRYMNQTYCSHIALVQWLENGTMATHKNVAEALGIGTDPLLGFHIDVEDYLIGLLILCSELARLAVNLASRAEYSRSLQISKFVTEVNMGFRLLQLKNDHLRKRYDALKYDVKTVKKVAYDIESLKLGTPSARKPQMTANPSRRCRN